MMSLPPPVIELTVATFPAAAAAALTATDWYWRLDPKRRSTLSAATLAPSEANVIGTAAVPPGLPPAVPTVTRAASEAVAERRRVRATAALFMELLFTAGGKRDR
jgi:hypothetical protein